MIDLSQQTRDKLQDLFKAVSRESFVDAQALKISIELLDNIDINILKVLFVLLAVPLSILLHCDQSTFIFLGFLELMPTLQLKIVSLVVGQEIDQLFEMMVEDHG
jgi:hypothetical protein